MCRDLYLENLVLLSAVFACSNEIKYCAAKVIFSFKSSPPHRITSYQKKRRFFISSMSFASMEGKHFSKVLQGSKVLPLTIRFLLLDCLLVIFGGGKEAGMIR